MCVSVGGAMYATRDTRVAHDNQLIFMQTQRSDGLMPGRVDREPGGRQGDEPDGGVPLRLEVWSVVRFMF